MFRKKKDIPWVGRPNERKDLSFFCEIIDITEKAELANFLSKKLDQYSIYAIMKISAGLDKEISLLPSPYRERSRPYFIEQLFGRYSKIKAMRSNGDFHDLRERIGDLRLYREFCNTESNHIRAICNKENDRNADHGPFPSLYYLLISCFYMFVLEEPGHPVGTPSQVDLRSYIAAMHIIVQYVIKKKM